MAKRTRSTTKVVVPALQAIPENGVSKVFGTVNNVLDALFIGSRLIKSQSLKAERVVDITTDGLVESAEWFNTTMRNNVAEAQK